VLASIGIGQRAVVSIDAFHQSLTELRLAVNAADAFVPLVRNGVINSGDVFSLQSSLRTTNASGATFSVSSINLLYLANSAVRTITNFASARPNQLLTLVFENGNTTIVNGAPIKLAGGVNFAGKADDSLVLLFTTSGIWVEVGRSVL
jgi:hypothetical protein